MSGKHRRSPSRRGPLLVAAGLLVTAAIGATAFAALSSGDQPAASSVRGVDAGASEAVSGTAATSAEAGPTAEPGDAAPAETVSGTASAAIDALDWDALAACLSSGDPAAVSEDGRHFGLYQFSVEAWESVGGVGLPTEASPAEQLERAKALYAEEGRGQWPTCEGRL